MLEVAYENRQRLNYLEVS